MAEYANLESSATPAAGSEVTFRGSPKNMAVGFALIFAGGLAFVMNLTHVFFAEALAWTFLLWGALFLLFDLVDYLETWTASEEGLRIASPVRFWRREMFWKWADINRVDLKVKRNEPDIKDMEMIVSHQVPGELGIDMDERIYSPQLANLIVERAGLQPAHAISQIDLENRKVDKGLYTWNKTGKLAST